MNALEFDHAGKRFGDLQALDDVSFAVKEGEFLALLGQNGAGKTTLINSLAGVTRLSSGAIRVFGTDTVKAPLVTKPQVGIVGQEVAFDPFFSPLEVMRMQRGFFGLPNDDEYLRWLLDKLSLSEKATVRSRQLSGGMRRRLMIAKALVHKPRILVLDEPTAGVDVELRQGLWRFLEELRQERQITILLTTHYLEEAEALADRVVIIHRGKLIADESKTTLLSRNQRILEVEYHSGTIEKIPIEKGESPLKRLQSLPDIKDFRVVEPRLEDIFLSLTKA